MNQYENYKDRCFCPVTIFYEAELVPPTVSWEVKEASGL